MMDCHVSVCSKTGFCMQYCPPLYSHRNDNDYTSKYNMQFWDTVYYDIILNLLIIIRY